MADITIVDSPAVVSVAISDATSSVTVTVPDSDLPPGGTTGQALLKSSDSNYHYTWGNLGAAATDYILLNYGTDQYRGRITGVTGQGYPIFEWEKV